MAFTTHRVSLLILEQLAGGEKRVLSLIVATGKALSRSESVKGDLSATVRSALRQLVAAKAIVNVDGVYSLPPQK